jgi:hypothetical protein
MIISPSQVSQSKPMFGSWCLLFVYWLPISNSSWSQNWASSIVSALQHCRYSNNSRKLLHYQLGTVVVAVNYYSHGSYITATLTP